MKYTEMKFEMVDFEASITFSGYILNLMKLQTTLIHNKYK